MTDPYQILGVEKTATDEEIKKAYKKAASKHHPDKGGDTAKFQEVQAAYETLSDPVKRQAHDNPNPFGHNTRGAGFNRGGFDFHFDNGSADINDLFRQFTQRGGSPFQQPQQRKNKDLRINIAISLASTLESQTKEINVQTQKGDSFPLTVHIPRGVAPGSTIKYAGQGDNFFESLTRGDLYVIINVLPAEEFAVSNNTLIRNLEISSIEAMLGVDKEVRGLDNKTFLLKIPAGCQYNTKLKLSGQGLYTMNNPTRGDLIVNVVIKTPTLTEEQKTILKTI